MKTSLTLLTALLLGFAAFAQHRSSLEISAGASIPIGDFGDKNLYSDKSGLAKTGQTINISYQHLLTRKVGFAVSLIGQRHPLDIHSLQSSMADVPVGTYVYFSSQPIIVTPPVIIPQHHEWQGEKSAWLSGSLLAGPYFEFPLDSKISLDAQAQAGASYIHAPKIHLNSETDSTTATLEQTAEHAIGFAYALRGGIAYKLSGNVSLLVNLQYFATSRAKFGEVKTTMSETQGKPGSLDYRISQARYTGEGRQALGAINVAAGLRLAL